MFNVRSSHFSRFLMTLFDVGLLPSTIASHRTSIASVLRHWKYDPASDPQIKMLMRSFRLAKPAKRFILPTWDLQVVFVWTSETSFRESGGFR